jgi:hypothetical protein
MEILAIALSKNTTIKTLYLDSNDITVNGLREITAVLQDHPTIDHLGFSGTN